MKRLFCNLYQDGLYFASEICESFEFAENHQSRPNYVGTYELIEVKPEQPQPEQQSSELKTMLIADAINAGLKVGAKVWIEVEVMKLPNEYDSEYLQVHTGSTGIFHLPKGKTEILFRLQPFIPNNGEKCRVETMFGNFYDCIATIMPDLKIYAFVEFDGKTTIYHPSEIKQLLPLE